MNTWTPHQMVINQRHHCREAPETERDRKSNRISKETKGVKTNVFDNSSRQISNLFAN